MNLLQSNLGRLQIVAFLEGLSFLLLLGIGMPLKYYFGYEHATQGIGMVHGLLFIAYVVMVFPAKQDLNWSWSRTFLVFLASVLPLGTFVAEYKIFRKVKA
jgi:integral membrane protein